MRNLVAAGAVLAAACAPAADDGATVTPSAESGLATATSPPAPVSSASGQTPFAAIGYDETIRLTGTEPFWGGSLRGGEMVYTTPDNPDGERIAVRRFAGNNGLGYSGTRAGLPLDLTITPGACSDGMSDRSYPLTATLKLGEEQREGCAWTDRINFSGSERR